MCGKNNPGLKSNNRFLVRSKLNLKLFEGVACPVIKVVAETGYGKSSAVLSFLRETDVSLVWIKFTDLDNNTSRFWVNLLEAISVINEDAARYFKSLGFPVSSRQYDVFLRAIAKEIYAGEQVVFVLDDFENVENPEVISFIENIVLSKMENFCTIFVSSNEINLNLKELEVTGDVYKLTEDDLRFDVEETIALFHLYNLQLNEEEAELLLDHTCGEGLLLHLGAVNISSWEQCPNDMEQWLKLVPYTHGDIEPILHQHFFSKFPLSIQKVLVQHALLYGASEQVIAKIFKGDLDLLNKALENNLFMKYNPTSGQYVLHQLYIDFLLEKTHLLSEDDYKEVYQSAAEWHEEKDRFIGAIVYYEKAQCWEGVYRVIFNHCDRKMPKETSDFFLEHLDKLPPSFVEDHLVTHALRAGLKFNNMEVDEARQMFLDILSKWEKPEVNSQERALLGEAYMVLSEISLVGRTPNFVEYYKKAAEYIPSGSAFRHEGFLFIENNDVVFADRSETGSLKKIQDAMFEAAPYADKVLRGSAYGLEYLFAAEAAYYTYDLKAARKYAVKAIEKAKEKNQHDIFCNGVLVLIKCFTAAGDMEKMMNCLKELRLYINRMKYPGLGYLVDCCEGWAYASLRNKYDIARWISDDLLLHKMPPVSVGRDRIIKAYYLIRQSKYQELLEYLETLKPFYDQRGIWSGMIELYLLGAICHHRMGRADNAAEYFLEAYNLTYKNGASMPFIEKGTVMVEIIVGLPEHLSDGLDQDWLNFICEEAEVYEHNILKMSTEYAGWEQQLRDHNPKLTESEIKILNGLACSMSLEEMSSSYRLPINTIRRKVKLIYRKMNAINRSDAVYSAVKMGLVSKS